MPQEAEAHLPYSLTLETVLATKQYTESERINENE